MSIPEHLRNVAITGGAGDIGRGITAELLRHGAHVTILDTRAPGTLGELISELSELGPLRYCQVDVTDHFAVTKALAEIDQLGIAIGNAAIAESAPFLDITPEQWRRHLDVNLTGCFNVGQVAARQMIAAQTRGRIIFTSSWVQDHPWPEIAPYTVSKAGLKMLTQNMAQELAEHGVVVNAIAPGIVRAGMARWQLENEPQYAARAATAVPLGDLQTVDQVARAVAFLCSDAADYMTGSTLVIDGGCSVRA